MKSHHHEALLPTTPSFHLNRSDGLFQPIRFVFVNERMRAHIAHERHAILEALSPEDRARQEKMFDSYDPHASHVRYQYILHRFRQSGTP